MELQKKTLSVAESKGWYLLQNEKRFWFDTEIDQETGNVVDVEKNEVVCKKGTLVNEIIQSLLEENGIHSVRVSNIALLGHQDKNLNLWESTLKVRTNKGNSKQVYIVTADCPAGAENFLSEWFEINVDGSCEFVTVKSQDYRKVIKLYDSEKEDIEANNGNIFWFKCQIYSLIDDDEENRSAGSMNLLVQASSFEKAISAVKSVMHRNEFDAIYNTFKSIQELNLEEVFAPDENVSYYSEKDID